MAPSVDASNSCIPLSSPLSILSPPLPTTVRGEPTVLDGNPGRLNADHALILYGSGRLVIVRELPLDVQAEGGGNTNTTTSDAKHGKTFVYRGHMATVTCAKFSPSGCYVASADVRGKLRVWSWDNDEHLCKLDLNVLTGPIRCIAWDFESKRICIAGERLDTSSDCVRVIQWDTGVTCGELAQHTRGRCSSCDVKPNRPMRIISGGMDDSRVYWNAGPPFKRVVDGVPTEDVHVKGSVNAVRFSANGTMVVSAGADKTVAVYDGKTMALKSKLENVHHGTIYGCSWNSADTHILTCSADGTAKLLSAEPLQVVHTWNIVEYLTGSPVPTVPIGGMVVGCTFVKNDVPVVVTINGELSLLPKPPMFTTGLDTYQKLTGHVAPIAGMAVDHVRGLLYTADTDGLLCQYSVATGEVVKRFSSPGSTDLSGKMHGDAIISCLTVVAGGSILTAGWDDTVRVVDSDGHVSDQPIVLGVQPNAMATGSQLTVVVTVGGLILIQNGVAVSPLNVLSYNALSVCVSLDDSTIYVGGEDCQIHVYSVSDTFALDEVHIIEGAHLKPIHALALSHGETKLASSDVRDICVWNLGGAATATATKPKYSPIIGKSRWCFHTQRITCLAWSPDDTILVSGGADDSIYLWSLLKPMKRVHYPFSHRGGVTGLASIRHPSDITKDENSWRLVSVGADSCVNQWNVLPDARTKFV